MAEHEPTTADLRKAVATAIFDPGATEGLQGSRTLTEWQTDAVMRALSTARLEGERAGMERAAKIADEAHKMRQRLFDENDALINAARACQAEELAAAIRAEKDGLK